MGILRDIFDASKDIKNIGDGGSFLKKRRYSSVSKRSLEGTLQFQTLITKAMDIDTAQIITKALERQFASFMQTVLTMSPKLNIQSDQDAIGFLRKFHQNTNTKTDLNDIVNVGRGLIESYDYSTNADDGFVLLSAGYEGSTGAVRADNLDQMVDLLEHVREDVLNNKFIPTKPLFNFNDRNLSAYHNRPVTEKAADPAKMKSAKNGPRDVNTIMTTIGGGVDNSVSMSSPTIQSMTVDARGSAGSRQDPGMDGRLVSDKLLRDNDVRKANELVPTTMHVRTILVNNEGENQGMLDFVVGIKATMHPVSSDEIVTNLLRGLRGDNKFFNFIRWTSGEISFLKDFLFNIKDIKDDVLDRSAGSSPYWIALKRRRKLAKITNNFLSSNQLMPNTSIVISQEEADFIRTQYGFDLSNPSVIDKLMRHYFLLAFVIVDSSAQISHFMFDGQTSYQSVSFSGLEKENSSKSDIRDVMKIINRSNMV